jgi:coenzyme PQQ precursor peptide PqqA
LAKPFSPAKPHDPGDESLRVVEAALAFQRRSYRNTEETVMAWKTPEIVEVPVGMEINMYACAARK